MKQTKMIVTTKRLLLCPVCEERGVKEILGELDEDGSFIVMRHRGNGVNGETKIISNSFEVKCGNCQEVVFYRKEKSAER